tara:strand:+ start:613 stop:1059 length:447 start_codon:yes stop_codon:yes gene_type:complete
LQKIKNQIFDIYQIETLALSLCKKIKVGKVIMLKGDLGVGKTTLSRSIINNLYSLNNLSKPNSIKSPTFPILLTYDLLEYEIYHYDFYRIKNLKELEQLEFFEHLNNSITLIEWPELLIDLPFKEKYMLINIKFHSDTKRNIDIKYFE